MRLFIAVPVPENLKKRIIAVQDGIRRAGVDAKFVEAENLHFTIKFLGEVTEEKTAEIRGAMEKACENQKVFEINVSGIGAFPGGNYARVVWLSVKEGLQEFEDLIKTVDEELSRIGFEKEKGYVPHLTLARVRSGRNRAELLRLLEQLENMEIGKMKVKELKLMKSTLSGKCPVYEEMFSLKLK